MSWTTYATISEADDYHDAHGEPSDWSDATDAEKTFALRFASEYLDQTYGTQWIGTRATSTQSRDWPRSNAEDRDGAAIDEDEIPDAVRDSTSYLALRYIEDGDLLPDLDSSGSVKVQRDKVGPLETEVEYVGGKSQTKVYGKVSGMLRGRGLLKASAGVVRA